MENPLAREQCQETADAILDQTRHRPEIAMILGSGLGPFADAAEHADNEREPACDSQCAHFGHLRRLQSSIVRDDDRCDAVQTAVEG